ncbi:hypothetical protein [Bacteroides heparinolyticus]|uniref:hypothetical protein n=1 Tax=Prevotella heparinolytica TaxID=28113 RepID=UPI0035A19A2B
MKLYRRQLTSFTDATLVSENFISDTSRKFNDTGRNKNEAELFFYSTSAAGADEYRIYDDESGEYLPTERVVYEIESPRLLDLRIIKNRAMMSETVNTLMAAQKAILEKMVADYTHIASTEKKSER